jgi:hypothetical protein
LELGQAPDLSPVLGEIHSLTLAVP